LPEIEQTGKLYDINFWDMSKKQIKTAKEPIRIRFKKLQNGNKSVYLDIYKDGVREYEFLKLYIVPEHNPDDKEKNRLTLELANKVKAKKILELDNAEHGFTTSGTKQKESVTEYLKALAEKSKREGAMSMHYSYKGLCRHLVNYKGERITFKHVTKDFCKGFNEYLKTARNGTYKPGKSKINPSGMLAQSTQHQYSNLLTCTLFRAMEDEYTDNNTMKKIPKAERLKKPDSSREYLTIDDIKQLAQTPCVKEEVKQAFLFTCYSGLRFSNVRGLKWGDFQTDNEGKNVIKYRQTKTKKHEYLQVSSDAMKFLPGRNGADDDDAVFNLSNNFATNQVLAGWVLAAGIKKRVTFHVSRHTNATLLLSLGVPIEIVSKLLGHSDIKTTQIYAKVIDQNKRAAVSRLDGII